MAKEGEPKQVTCPNCDSDVPESEIENGRCPKCSYHIGLDNFFRQYDSVREKERKKGEVPAKELEKKKKSGLTGWGI